MIKEEYKNIPDTEFVPLKEGIDPVFWGKYEINKKGEIRRISSGLLVRIQRKENRVSLRSSELKKKYTVHILLAKTFLIIPENSKHRVKPLDKSKPLVLDNLQWEEEILKSNSPKISRWMKFNTLEDFQKYIDENDIKSPKDFQNKNSGLYYRASHILKISMPELIYPNRILTNWNSINTLEDLKKYIEDNNISKSDYVKIYNGLYQRMVKRGIFLDDIFPDDIIKSIGHKYDYYDSEEKILELIKENNIKSPTEFHEFSDRLYRKSLQYNNLIYERPLKSRGEKILEDILIDLGFDFVYDESANFLSRRSRLDFRLDKYKLVIEYQGTQHFLDSSWTTFEEQYNLDKKKYEECVNAGYTVVYVIFSFLDRDRYQKINFETEYLGKLFHNKEDLIKYLKQFQNETNSNL